MGRLKSISVCCCCFCFVWVWFPFNCWLLVIASCLHKWMNGSHENSLIKILSHLFFPLNFGPTDLRTVAGCKCILFWQSEQDMRNLVTASRGRKAYISATCEKEGGQQKSKLMKRREKDVKTSIELPSSIIKEVRVGIKSKLKTKRRLSESCSLYRTVSSFLTRVFSRPTIHFHMDAVDNVIKVLYDSYPFVLSCGILPTSLGCFWGTWTSLDMSMCRI